MASTNNGNRMLIGLMILLLVGSYGYTWLATRENRDLEILREQVLKNRDDLAFIKQRQDERTSKFPDLDRRIGELERVINSSPLLRR